MQSNRNTVASFVSLCCLMLLLDGAVSGQQMVEKDSSSAAKKRFDFDHLPGKDGSIRAMADLDVAKIVSQHGTFALRDEKQRFIAGLGTCFTYDLIVQRRPASAQAAVEPETTQPAATAQSALDPGTLKLYVGASPKDAHSMLFMELGGDLTNMRITDYLSRFEKTKDVGDFCIITKGRPSRPEIRFARDNIAVSVCAGEGMSREVIIAISKDIEASINKQQIMSQKDLDATLAVPTLKSEERDAVIEGDTVKASLVSPLTLLPGQEVIVSCDDGTEGSYDAKNAIIACKPRRTGTRHVAVGVYDKASGLTRWAVEAIVVQPHSPAGSTSSAFGQTTQPTTRHE